MANAFSFTAYAYASTYDAKNGGWQVSSQFGGPAYLNLPVVGTKLTAVSPAMSLKVGNLNVTINSIIEVLPNGLTTPGFTQKYLSDGLFSTLAGNRNT